MTRKIYLHIGTPKTGTTTLQTFMLKNNDLLNAKNYDYVNLNLQNDKLLSILRKYDLFEYYRNCIMNGELFRLLYQHKKLSIEEILNLYLKYSDAENIIISSERIYQFIKIDDLLSVKSDLFELKIILFLRDPIEYFSSLWCTRVIQGAKKNIEEFLSNNNLLSWEEAQLNCVANYDDNFPVNLDVIPYNKSKDMVECFFSRLKLDITDIPKAPSRNISMNFIFSNLLLFANRTGLRGAPNPLCHNHITDPIYFFFQDYKLKYKLPSALAFVPKNKKDEIISILKTPHDQIAKKFFQNNVLFESDNKETHNIHEDVRQGIDINIFNDFTKFVASHNILCLKNDNHNMTFSSQSSQSIENKKASFLFKPNLVAVVERIIFNALCCFIPTKRLRCFVRNKGAIKLNRFIGKIVASFFIKKTTRKKIRCYFEDLVDAQ